MPIAGAWTAIRKSAAAASDPGWQERVETIADQLWRMMVERRRAFSLDDAGREIGASAADLLDAAGLVYERCCRKAKDDGCVTEIELATLDTVARRLHIDDSERLAVHRALAMPDAISPSTGEVVRILAPPSASVEAAKHVAVTVAATFGWFLRSSTGLFLLGLVMFGAAYLVGSGTLAFIGGVAVLVAFILAVVSLPSRAPAPPLASVQPVAVQASAPPIRLPCDPSWSVPEPLVQSVTMRGTQAMLMSLLIDSARNRERVVIEYGGACRTIEPCEGLAHVEVVMVRAWQVEPSPAGPEKWRTFRIDRITAFGRGRGAFQFVSDAPLAAARLRAWSPEEIED